MRQLQGSNGIATNVTASNWLTLKDQRRTNTLPRNDESINPPLKV